jgi:hypothetical protein
MTWLTWRQFRAQLLVAAAGLALVAIYLVHLGGEIRAFYDTRIAGCAAQACYLARMDLRDRFDDRIGIMVVLLIAVPGLIGAFWGAPLVAQELEQRTDRLVWNQSVTRTRWLAVKLAVTGLCAAVLTGLFSLLLTWAVSRYDEVVGERFAALTFDSRNIVPIGYALFAFALGTVAGMVVRRTVPAMAITLVAFAAVQLLVPAVVRQHLMQPVTDTVAVDAAVLNSGVGMNLKEDGTFDLQGYTAGGSWSLESSSPLLKADGSAYRGEDARPCLLPGDREAGDACTVAQHLHFAYTRQPGGRYWAFQWIELSLFVALALLLTGFGFYWVRRRV